MGGRNSPESKPIKMHEMASQRANFSKISRGGGGGACPRIPLETRAFGARKFPRPKNCSAWIKTPPPPFRNQARGLLLNLALKMLDTDEDSTWSNRKRHYTRKYATILFCEFYFYRIFVARANSHTKSCNILYHSNTNWMGTLDHVSPKRSVHVFNALPALECKFLNTTI